MLKSMDKEVIVGDTIYEIIEKIGEGAYGSIAKAKIQGSPTLYAIKSVCLNTNLMESIEQTAIIETSALQRLNHSNIIKPIGFSVSNNKLRIVMPYGGESLYMKKLDRTVVKSVMFQLFSACKHMQECDVIHRDIKSPNILIDKNNKVSLIDFGISSISKSDTSYDHVVTLPWRSPAIILGLKSYDIRLDIWSLGSFMYNILTGKFCLFDAINGESSYVRDVACHYEEGIEWHKNKEITPKHTLLLRQKLEDMKLHPEDIDMMCFLLRWRYEDIPYPEDCMRHPYFSSLTIPTHLPSALPSAYPMISKIDRRMRFVLFDWICDVTRKFLLSRHVLLSTIALFDRYEKSLLSGHRSKHHIPESTISTESGIPKCELQVLGMACFYLVASSNLATSAEYGSVRQIGAHCNGSYYLDKYVLMIYEAVGYQVLSDIPSLEDTFIYSAIHGDVLDQPTHDCIYRLMDDKPRNYPERFY